MLRLASQQPVADITVADLVRAARVNRTTFYKHAASPAAVLAQAVHADLDEVRAGWIDETLSERRPVEEIWERACNALIDRDPAILPAGYGPAEWRARAYGGFAGHGEVSLVESWLALPAPRDRRLFISAAVAMLPDWLAAYTREQ